MKYQRIDGQYVTPQSEFPEVKASSAAVQRQFHAAGAYKPYENKIEEHIPELIVAQEFRNELQEHGWKIEPRFLSVSSTDIILTHIRTGYTVRIDVKTKLEQPELYTRKVEGTLATDRTASIPEKEIEKVLYNSEFLLFTSTSKTEAISGTLDNSTTVIGIAETKLLSPASFSILQGDDWAYGFLDPSHEGIVFSGRHALYQLCGFLQVEVRHIASA